MEKKSITIDVLSLPTSPRTIDIRLLLPTADADVDDVDHRRLQFPWNRSSIHQIDIKYIILCHYLKYF